MLTHERFSQIGGVAHGFFTREGGASTGMYASLNCGYGSGDEEETVSRNREQVARAMGVGSESLCTAYQTHSSRAVVLEKPWAWRDAPQADALVTNVPGIALGVLTADCLPILMADPKNRVIAAVHAGWKGVLSGIVESAVKSMLSLGAAKEEIFACVGPAIGPRSYEVGGEFCEMFMTDTMDNNIYFSELPHNGKFLFDLPAYGTTRLRRAGLSRINVLAHDTCMEENAFFSYRRSSARGEKSYGRQISAIVLK